MPFFSSWKDQGPVPAAPAEELAGAGPEVPRDGISLLHRAPASYLSHLQLPFCGPQPFLPCTHLVSAQCGRLLPRIPNLSTHVAAPPCSPPVCFLCLLELRRGGLCDLWVPVPGKHGPPESAVLERSLDQESCTCVQVWLPQGPLFICSRELMQRASRPAQDPKPCPCSEGGMAVGYGLKNHWTLNPLSTSLQVQAVKVAPRGQCDEYCGA